MGTREDLVRQRLDQKAAQEEIRQKEYQAERRQREQTLFAELQQLIGEIHKEAARIIQLFESADWAMAQLKTWRVGVTMPQRFWQRRPRVKQRDVELAYLTLPNSGEVIVRSDNTLHVKVRYGGPVALESFIGEELHPDQRTINSLSHYKEEARCVLEILKGCTKAAMLTM